MKVVKNQIIKDLLLFGIAIPSLYILLSLSPWAKKLFIEKDRDYFVVFWLSIVVIHWLSFLLVRQRVKARGHGFSDYGYKLSKYNTLYLIFIYFVIAFGFVAIIELTIDSTALSHSKISEIPMFFPVTSFERIVFIFSVFTAAICEEIIYRGFLIESFRQIGVNKWIALLLAGVSFVFIHGIIGFYKFPFYYLPALFFGILYILSKRLLPNIIVHLVFDVFGVFAIYQAFG